MCITLHILKQVKQFYIWVPVQMIHVLALSEWMCEKNNSVQIHYENKCKWTDASYLLKSSNENSEICKEIYNRKVMARSWLFINK